MSLKRVGRPNKLLTLIKTEGMSNRGNKTYNRLYDHPLYLSISSARQDLSGFYHMDEHGVEYSQPAKDVIQYYNAYGYQNEAMESYWDFADTFKEVLLIRSQIQHSQDFVRENDYLTTDELLTFCYKNWIIRITMIAEKIFAIANHIYQLKISNSDIINGVFAHKRIKADNNLYLTLLNLADFLYENTLVYCKTPGIKRSRNQILHDSKFQHKTISWLTSQIFMSKYLTERFDEEDLYLLEGLTSEKIKNEITTLSNEFLTKCVEVLALVKQEFTVTFSRFIQDGDNFKKSPRKAG
jgi:hypothetical protein